MALRLFDNTLVPFNHFFDDDWLIFDPRFDSSARKVNKKEEGPNALQSFMKGASPLMSTDISETETTYAILADLPGVSVENIDISIVDNNVLQIKAERKHEHTQEDKERRFHSTERSFGVVQRKFRFPKNADLNNTQVNFNNGVLDISVPKMEPPANNNKKLVINTK